MVRVFSPACVVLLLTIVVAAAYANSLVRKRREWILPPKPLKENEDYTKRDYIAKIRSDYEENNNINYALEGIGANKAPFNVFIVDSKTGFIKVTQILDREEIDTYNLSGIATFIDGTHAETKIDIRIKVVDENDNAPVFPRVIKPGEVPELSPVGTEVMTVTATDRDEPGTLNSQLSYSLLRQEPPDDMFYIKPNGTIYVKKNTLDRETVDLYVLTLKATDLNGDPRGKTGTGTVTIRIQDVNDNLPTLERTEYKANIMENHYGVEVMRFKATDLDLVNTPNWEPEFVIARGNEAGYFSIIMDPKTHEGILMLNKAVDYEDVKDLDLGVIVRNKAPMYDGSVGYANVGFGGAGGSSGTQSGAGGTTGAGGASGASGGSGSEGIYHLHPVKINVQNEPEGPRFDPKVKAIPISEGGTVINLKEVITRYQAIDQDTGKPAENVRYVKGTDPGNWLIIDPVTADIKLNKLPDRESPLLVNGTYYAEILCISEDMPGKTATGTIAIQVEDFNDNCPTLTLPMQTLCLSTDAVLVNAADGDAFPNGPPFTFTIIPENTKGKWQVEHLNDTAVILRAEEPLWPGVYEVEFIITDQQGESCPKPQRVHLQVCTCEDGVKCGRAGGLGKPERKVKFGPGGIGLLFLGLLMLLLLPLLALFCYCGGMGGLSGGFAEMPYDTKSHLINYHTEGQGENTEVPLMNMQTTQMDGNMHIMSMGGTHMSNMEFQQRHTGMSREVVNGYYQGFGAGQMEGNWRGGSGSGFQSEYMSRERETGMFDGMALPHHYLGQYYNQKVQSSEAQAGKDSLLVYDYEGQGSVAGSVGCCSSLALDNDLQFLDDLDPKFKTLAEICGGKTRAEVRAPAPLSTSMSSHTAVSRVMAPGPLPEPIPTPLPAPRAEVSSSVVRESSERSQTITVKEISKEAPQVPAPQVPAPQAPAPQVPAPQAPQGQMLLLQQPQPQPQLYYTTAPVLQPMHYMVQPSVQNTVLLREAPGPNMQSVMLVNGPPSGPAQGLMMQGQHVMQGQVVMQGQAVGQGQVVMQGQAVGQGQVVMQGQAVGQHQVPGMVLVEKAQGPGASLSSSQTKLLVEGKGPSGSKQVLKSGQSLVQPGLSGSQTLLVVGSSSAQGQEHGVQSSLPGGLSGSKRALNKSSSSSTKNITVNSMPSGSKRVVVQETREVIQTNM